VKSNYLYEEENVCFFRDITIYSPVFIENGV
jgi:hypothetical protein